MTQDAAFHLFGIKSGKIGKIIYKTNLKRCESFEKHKGFEYKRSFA